MSKILILLILPIFSVAYVILNVIVVAWLSRNTRIWFRRTGRFLNGELSALSSTRMWVTTASYLISVSVVVFTLRGALELLELVLVLLGYVFFVIAITISLLAQLPFMRKIWDDPFFKVCALGLPFPLVFLAKGFAFEWVGELTGSTATNFPMTYVAATSFLLLLLALIGLSVILLIFEALFIAMVVREKQVWPKIFSKETLVHIFSVSERKKLSVRLRSSAIKKRIGVLCMSLWIFVACLFGAQALASLLSSRVGNVLLLAIAFDFDGAPASRCELNDEESKLANRSDPVLKAVFLSTAQDKALLIERGPTLFSPAILAKMGKEMDVGRSLKFGRVVKCYEPEGQAGGSE